MEGLAAADAVGVVEVVVGVSDDEKAVVVVAAVDERGGAVDPGGVDVVGVEIAGLVVEGSGGEVNGKCRGWHNGISAKIGFYSTPTARVEGLGVREGESNGGTFAFADNAVVGEEGHLVGGIEANGNGVMHTDTVESIPITVGTAIDAFDHVACGGGGIDADFGVVGVKVGAVGIDGAGSEFDGVDDVAVGIFDEAPPADVFNGFALRGETPCFVGGGV